MVTLDIMTILRILFSVGFALGTGLAAFTVLADSIRRFRFLHPIGLGLASLCVGGMFLVYRALVYPQFWYEGISFSFIFYSAGFFLFKVHHVLTKQERFNVQLLLGFSFIISITISLQLFWLVNDETLRKISFQASSLTVFLVGVPTLLVLIHDALKDVISFRIKNQVAELIGYVTMFITLVSSVITHAVGLNFHPVYVFVTLFASAFSALSLFYAYATNRAYLYRIPFKIYYLVGYHDSGMTFFQLEIPNPKFSLDRREVLLVNNILSTIDVAVRHLLKQELQENLVKCKHVCFYLHRNPQKRIIFGVISERLSWYLRKSMETMTTSFSSRQLFRDGEIPLLEEEHVHSEMMRVLKKTFPYLVITMTRISMKA